jgi:hypothetical protein
MRRVIVDTHTYILIFMYRHNLNLTHKHELTSLLVSYKIVLDITVEVYFWTTRPTMGFLLKKKKKSYRSDTDQRGG